MQIEYKIKFEDGGVTVTQTVEPCQSPASRGHAAIARPGRQLASTLVETQHLDRLAGGPTDQPGGRGGGPTDQPGGRGGGPTDQPGGRGGALMINQAAGAAAPMINQAAGAAAPMINQAAGVGANISSGGHAAVGSGKVSAVIFGPLVISGF